MKNARLISRLAFFGLVTILFILTGVLIWTVTNTRAITNDAKTSVHLNGLYQQARYVLTEEKALQYEYFFKPTPEVLGEFRATAALLANTLSTLRQDGSASDSALVQEVLAEHEHYLRTVSSLFAAIDAHEMARASTIQITDVVPAFSLIGGQVYTATRQYNEQTNQRLVDLNTTQHTVFQVTLTVFALGLSLMGLFGFVLRVYQRNLDAATQAELERLARAALTDNLTDLGNHRAYQEDVHRELEHARRHEETVGLALINVDGLKMLNDEHGHLYGDHILSELATLLRDAKVSDYIYRLSGDEFAMILPHTTLTDTVTAMERLRQEAQQRLSGATVSTGIATTVPGESDIDILHAQADAALSEAKRHGRNVVVTFEDIQEWVSLVSAAKVHALLRLLAERKITIAFQPIWDLARGGVLAFEALTRPAAEYGFAGPQEAFDTAEKLGRAHELDFVCLQAILARAVELPPEALLFVNLTPQTLDHDLLTGSVLLEAVVSAGLTPDRVVLELTERSITRPEVVARAARQLRDLGFRLALDDMGAGNAGLETLSQLPVSFVKIDRAVVASALSDKTARGILVGIQAIARETNIYVIAEGIENAEMFNLVRQIGVQGVQGYLFGRPSETIPDERALQGLNPVVPTA